MKRTKCLFDENKMTADGCISVSQLQTFLSCRKKWEYSYIEDLKPRVERSYLTIGKLCHTGMQHAMMGLWAMGRGMLKAEGDPVKYVTEAAINAMRVEHGNYMIDTDFLPEEIPDMEQMLSDAEAVFSQAFFEFQPWKYEVITLYNGVAPIPALELHFRVPCPPTKGLHGYIDAILRDKETGLTWCVDYKFRKSLSPDEDEAFNIQNAVYTYACQKMEVDIAGTMTWQHINTPAAEPTVLKGGKISRSKIKTTWEKYADFCRKNGQDPEEYREEMEEKLAGIEWWRATREYRNEGTVARIWNNCVIPVAKQIKLAHGKKADNFRSMYPWNCTHICPYGSLCQAELRDYDAESIRDREYTKRHEPKQVETQAREEAET